MTRNRGARLRGRASAYNVGHRMSSALQRASSSRRSPSISSPPHSTTINRGATARSAINPRVSASLNSPRRSLKSTTPPPVGPDAQDALAASLRRETEEKERVYGRVPSLPPARY